MNSTVELVTPEMAESYLATFPRTTEGKGQRRLRPAWVKDLAHAMDSGEFYVTHQGLAFNTRGQMFDGQHRCQAIIMHGKPVRIMVTRGVDEEAWKAIDIGAKRSIADITNLEKRIAEPLRFAARVMQSTKACAPTADEIIRLHDSPIGAALNELLAHCPTTNRYFSSAPMKLAAAIWMAKGNPQYPKEQYSALVYQNYDDMSACSKALCRQVAMQRVSSGEVGDSVSRAYKVFDPSKAANSKIQIGEGEIRATYAAIRQDLHAILNPEESSRETKRRFRAA